MKNVFYPVVSVLLLIPVVGLMTAVLLGALPTQKRAEDCKKLGGVYFYKEEVCMRGELFIKEASNR